MNGGSWRKAVLGQSAICVVCYNQTIPNQILFFEQSGHAHAPIKALALKKKNRIIARCVETEAADCEGRFERQPCLRCGPRLIQLAGKCEGGGEMEMRGKLPLVSML